MNTISNNSQKYIKTNAINKPIDEIIKSPVDVLLGVSEQASEALKKINIQSVFDLSFSDIFKYAEMITNEKDSVFIKTKQFPSNLFDDLAIDKLDFEEIREQSISIFKGISDENGRLISNALSVAKIRDLALWPPYLAAKEIVASQYGLGMSGNDDPESPQDLVPKTGEYPVEVIYYNTFVLAHSPETSKTAQLEDSGAIEINFDEKISGFDKPGWGAMLKYSQQWFAEGITLGNLIKCIPLGPGETTKIAVIDWQRTTRGSTTEDITQSERVSNELTQKRAINEIAEATAAETQSGFSGSAAVSSSSNAGFGIGGLIPGLPGLFGGTASNSNNVSGSASYATSSGEKDISSYMQQNIDNSTHQNSFSARNKRASIVTELSEKQSETISTRSLTNYNHMHALTLQYWQVVQIFRTEVKLEKYQRTLYIPLKPFDFRNNENIVTRFKSILIRAAQSEYVRSLLIASSGQVAFNFQPGNPGEAFSKEPDPTLSGKEKIKEAKDIARKKQIEIAKGNAKERMLFNIYQNSELIFDYDFNKRSWKMPGTFQLVNVRWSSQQATIISKVIINVENGVEVVVTANGTSFNSNAINPDFNGLISFDTLEGISIELDAASSENTIHKLELKIDTGNGIFKEMSFNFMVGKNKTTESVLDINPPQRSGELAALLNEQALYYSQQIWLNMDIHFLTLMFARYTYKGKRIVEYIDPKPVSVAGNCLAFIWKDADKVNDKEWITWINEQIDEKKITRQRVALPTDGVFAEAVLGRSNAAEKIDITRFWNWQDSPIPFSAPDIAAIQSGQQSIGNVPSIGGLENPIVNIMNPSPLPDPTGMQAVTGSLNANIFRDMSGLAQTAALAQAALNASSQGATAAGSQAGANMATYANFYTEMARIVASLAPMLAGLPPSPLTGGKNITNAGGVLNAAKSMDGAATPSGNGSGNADPSNGNGSSNPGNGGSSGESTGPFSQMSDTIFASTRGETGKVMDMIRGTNSSVFPESNADRTLASNNFFNTQKDFLAELTPEEKRDFYKRLADKSISEDPDSLAGKTLAYWLTVPNQKLILSNARVKNLESIISAKNGLLNEVKPVILSQKPAFLNNSRVGIRGIKDRILGLNGHVKWDGISTIPISYQGPSIELVTTDEFQEIQQKELSGRALTEQDKIKADVFSSFHECALNSNVVLKVKELVKDKKYEVEIESWKCKLTDNYNWDSGIAGFFFKLTLPNPDFQNPLKIPNPVAPGLKFITINHSNAKDVENEGLAESYDFESEEWDVTDKRVLSNFVLNI